MDPQKALEALRRGRMRELLDALDWDDWTAVYYPDGDITVAVRFGATLLTSIHGPMAGSDQDMVVHAHDSDNDAIVCLRNGIDMARRQGLHVHSTLDAAPLPPVSLYPPPVPRPEDETQPGTLPIPGLVTGPDGRPEAFHF